MLDSNVNASFGKLIYRYRFLALYIVIGFTSLWVELLVYHGLSSIGLHEATSFGAGIASGIIFAYWMNVRFNFKVPVAKRNRALLYFLLISLISGAINFTLKSKINILFGWSHEFSRFVVSGSFFAVFYFFHRRFTFRDLKQVGVAVYTNGVENIKEIYKKIGMYPDFIHVDLIDETFDPNAHEVTSYRLETIHAYWPKKKTHAHIMSRRPTRWLSEVLPFADVVYIHIEIDEDIREIIGKIKEAGKTPGIAIMMGTPVKQMQMFVHDVSYFMLLTIPKPGKSGQVFQIEAIERIEEIMTWPERENFSLCVDGGVNGKNVHLLNVEYVVSGSAVINSSEPQKEIMRLQTSNNYEAI